MAAAMWTLGSGQVVALLAFVTSIVIARFLSPDQLGRYALATAIAAVVTILTTIQAGGYYIVAEKASDRLLRSGLTLELGLGFLGWGLLAAGAGVFAALSGNVSFAGLIVVAGFVTVTNSLGTLQGFFTRDLAYRLPSLCQTASTLLGATVKIVLVIAGLNAWGLVIGDVAISATFGLLMLWAVPAGRGLVFDRALARIQLAWGLPVMANAFMGNLLIRTQEFIIAGALGTRDLGFFYLAYRIPAQLYQLARSLSVPFLASFSRASKAQLRQGFPLITQLSAYLVALPLALSLVLGDGLINLMYGTKWDPSVWPFILLTWVMGIRFVTGFVGQLLQSQRRVLEIMMLTALQLALTVAACLAGALVGGLVGATAGALLVEVVLTVPRVRLSLTVVDFRFLREVRNPILALIVAAVLAAVPTALIEGTPGLLAGVALGTAGYFSLALTRDGRNLRRLTESWRREGDSGVEASVAGP